MGTTETTYPEHEKLQAVNEKSQAIGEFLDWLRDEKRVQLVTWEEWEEEEPRIIPVRKPDGTLEETYMAKHEGYVPVRQGIEALLADFYEIDLKKIETEKRAMLDAIRAQNQAEGGQ